MSSFTKILNELAIQAHSVSSSKNRYDVKPSKTLIYFFYMVAFFINFQVFPNGSSTDSIITLKYKAKTFSIDLKNLRETLLFVEVPRTVPYNDEKLLQYSDKIVNDSLVILNNFEPFYKPIKEIDWKENPNNNDTWQLYYQNLFFVSTLNHAYYNTKNIKYHNKAKEYIKHYISYHEMDTISTSKFSWYDHSTAFRVLHILQTVGNELTTTLPDNHFIQTAFNHIGLNIKFMVDPKNYLAHNHSLMMDRTLLYLANILENTPELSNDLRQISSKRALANFDQLIDNSGMAKEHSMTYHIFNHNLYKSIFKLLGNYNTPTDKLLKYLKMSDVLLQLVKPDLTFPLWGDSQVEVLNPKLITDFEEDHRLTEVYNSYNLSSNVNFENNIATLRTQTNDKSYLALFANYYSKVHKHHDDLSVIFQTFGTDIFTDQGYYGYEAEYRPKLTSVFGHNTVAVNNEDYSIGRSDQYSNISSYLKKNDYEMVEASHNMYDSLKITRKIYFVKPNLIVVNDNLEGMKNIESLSQIYNLGEGATKIKIDNNTISFSMPKNIDVTMQSVDPEDEFINKKFFKSPKPYQIKDTEQIVLYSKNLKRATTLILLNSESYLMPISKPKITNNILSYFKDGQEKQINLNY